MSVERSNSIDGVFATEGAKVEIRQTINNYAAGQSPAVPREIPVPSYVFDREVETNEFKALVGQGSGAVLICGMAGVGKTTCLRKWADSSKNDYPDGQLFIDVASMSVGGVTPVPALQRRALRALLPERARSISDEDVDPVYRSVTAEKRLLIE